MDKKTTYIILAAVIIIVVGGLWFVMQNYSTNNQLPVDNPPVQNNNANPTKAEVKSETQVAKEMNGLRITMDDNNQSMSMTPGKNLIMMLGADYAWTIASSDETVLGKNPTTSSDARVQAVYKALKAGSAVLTATGACAQGKTCANPTAAFKYTVDVVVSDDVPAEDLVK